MCHCTTSLKLDINSSYFVILFLQGKLMHNAFEMKSPWEVLKIISTLDPCEVNDLFNYNDHGLYSSM